MSASTACGRAHVRAHAPTRKSQSSQMAAAAQAGGRAAAKVRSSAARARSDATSENEVAPPAAMHSSAVADTGSTMVTGVREPDSVWRKACARP